MKMKYCASPPSGHLKAANHSADLCGHSSQQLLDFPPSAEEQ